MPLKRRSEVLVRLCSLASVAMFCRIFCIEVGGAEITDCAAEGQPKDFSLFYPLPNETMPASLFKEIFFAIPSSLRGEFKIFISFEPLEDSNVEDFSWNEDFQWQTNAVFVVTAPTTLVAICTIVGPHRHCEPAFNDIHSASIGLAISVTVVHPETGCTTTLKSSVTLLRPRTPHRRPRSAPRRWSAYDPARDAPAMPDETWLPLSDTTF
eukprot:CAMPEP_0113692972 /NCGR_PEP_ID=MMETSP0038_2-20120614/19403_1 /TAXON_ID=2898 /ORGANISM="Cryptomonas paramecium" /LENGTH=209 /DNA_ID=CAMNT_0000614987 /DNA_START=78 /DNA_END=704 /DNA_ORIENTATION=- /assembly_acc=CAM_ASM_000170